MVKEYPILQAIKAKLDSDPALITYLEVPSGGSKVILGAELPSGAMPPLINVALLDNTVLDLDTKFSELPIALIVRVKNLAYGLTDYAALDNISSRIVALLDDQTLTITAGHFISMVAEGAMPEMPDLDFDEKTVTIKQYRYRVQAI